MIKKFSHPPKRNQKSWMPPSPFWTTPPPGIIIYDRSLDWGWYMINGKMLPVMMDLAPLLKNNCKTGCGGRCSCRRNGLECNVACGECKGVSCTNSEDVELSIDEPKN
jgi:hypothetical protein